MMTLPTVREEIDEWASNRIYEEVPALRDLEQFVKHFEISEEQRQFEKVLGEALYPAISAAFALGIQAALNPAMLVFCDDDPAA